MAPEDNPMDDIFDVPPRYVLKEGEVACHGRVGDSACEFPAVLCIHHGGHDACAVELMKAQSAHASHPPATAEVSEEEG